MTGLLSAGFTIRNVLPLWDKKGASNALKVLIVCGKPGELSRKATRRGFVSTFKKEFPTYLDSLLKNVDTEDQRILAMGCGLRLYSEYKEILNADGTNMNTHDALQIIVQEMDDYFSLLHTN